MIPAAIVRMNSLPLTSSDKIDRKALPLPDNDAFALQDYEAPRGETEIAVSNIWADLLSVDRVGRNDNFFALGGHSLLAIKLIERLRRIGLTLTIRALFESPTLSSLAQSLEVHHDYKVPPNLITPYSVAISPEMLPLIDLNQDDIDSIIKRVPGGVSNIQDIYSLSPLQEGILFHHLLATKGDPYLLLTFTAFDTRDILDRYLDAIQKVVDRHDILRTAFIWENMSTSAQVVWRKAPLSITELQLDQAHGPVKDQLMEMLGPQMHRIDLSQAPLISFTTAQDTDGRWLLAELHHHLISDHSTLDVMFTEIKSFMDGQGYTLPSSQPFRNLIAHAKFGRSQDDHKKFFTEMLADIDTPSLPFGLKDVHGEGRTATESYRSLPQELSDQLRRRSKELGVSVASLCHLAWALVISRTSGEDRVVFGTVLFGRMDSGHGSENTMGLFINTLPLRVDLDKCVKESVLETHQRLACLLDHEHASLILAQQCSSVPHGTPLFSAMLNYRHNDKSTDDNSLAFGVEHIESREHTNYPLTLSVEDFGTEMGLTVHVVRPLDPDRICGYMQKALQSLADAIIHSPEMAVHKVEVLPTEEQEMLLRTWNKTKWAFPEDLCIHQLFEKHAESTPNATALVCMNRSLTYAELNKRANRLAHRLIQMGVKPDSLVAICVDQSFAIIAGMLAILKAGGAYVPLDPKHSCERLQDIIADADPAVVVADESGRMAIGQSTLSSRTVIDPNEEDCSAPIFSDSNPKVSGLTSSNLVYIIYTSGSTGEPKGVMIEHHGLVNFILTRPDVLGTTASSRVPLFFSFAFDACVSDVFMTICLGGCLHFLPDDIRSDSERLWNFLEPHSITQLTLTPTILESFLGCPPQVMPFTLVVVGETLSPTLLRGLWPLVPNGEIINDYGPTETTIGAISWRSHPEFNGDIVPIGHPIANKSIYLLDKNRQPVPLGAIGELYIGGVGVARGYLNRPELTAKAFLPDPFVDDKEARMYKTGDMARYLPDGNVVFLGRNDHQVKIRGFRIELGEIEARLVDHPLVDTAIVIAMGESANKKLVGYVVAPPEDQLVHTLRAHLTSCLPDYMVPAAIVRLDSLPITPIGKLDRKALPLPDGDAFERHDHEAPQGDTEITIARIWETILGIDRVSRNDNFFALGGHSLLAVKLMNRISTLGAQLPLSTIFVSPCLSTFAERVDSHLQKEDGPQSNITSIPREGGLPLSFAQQRMWFLAQMEGVSETYHMPSAVRLRGDIDRKALQQALNTIFARHEALRSVFVNFDGQPQVQILSPEPGVPVRWEDLRGTQDPETQLTRLSNEGVNTPFDLTQGPLIRALVVQLDHNEHYFLITQHHIVSDGWSSGIFHRELSVLYSAYCKDESSPLPPLEIQYPDYATWQREELSGSRLETLTSYWRNTLADAPILLNLPTDRPRPPQQSYAGDEVSIELDSQLSSALKKLSQDHGVTLYTTILAAWSSILSRLSGQDDIIIGTPVANRNHHQIESLIGFFVNSLALRIDHSGDPTVGQLLDRVRKATLDGQSHQDLPFEQVVDI
ncbi:hypothetical protein BGX31_001927, partial [Mortierella sp. GBA43]